MSATYVDEARASMPAANVMMSIPGLQPASNGAASSIAKRIHREVRFGNYILGSTLGEGEFGKVKLGWRKDGKQPSQVAIKLIKRDSILKDSDSEIKVHREINSLKLLNHPNIVNLVEVMKLGKYIGIVLEYASGGELFDYILHHKYLKENVAKKLFAQLVSGVDYMHSKGLIHRDLKLENLLLDKHKNVIISDFGFVNSYNRDKNDLMKTSCGSPCYAAPELVLTQSPYEGRKVDIWSLGVILYAMLSGYLPFDDDPENEDGADIVRLYHYICKTPLTFPEYVSPLARDLLRKIIVPDPKKRINMNDIRNHPWLTPHVNLLSIRQPEWDRIYKENRQPPNTVQQNANKRFSMLNERTSSSALMPKHGRSSSNGGINPSSATTLSSLANAIALPSSKSSSTITINYNFNNNTDAGTAAGGGNSNNSSATPSPTKQYARGHVKSASMSSSHHQQPQNLIFHQSAASTALKAVVSDSNNFKRNSISSITSLTSSIGGGGAVNGSSSNISSGLSRSSTYNGAISTIVESPTKTYLRNPDKNSTSASAAAALSAAASAARQQQQQQLKTSIPEGSNFISLLPSRAGYNSTRLPHSEKKPRPTSYHPSSMSSTLISNSNVGSSVNGILDYMSPMNLQIPQFLSSSPTKTSPIADSDASPVSESNNNNNNSSSPASTGVKLNARRNSAVTPINVNGVLTSEHESNKNSVLNYLEDKIDALELTDLHSPSKEQFNPQDKQATVEDAETEPKPKQRPLSQNVESLIPKVVEDFKKEKAKEREREREKEKEKERDVTEKQHQARERKQRISTIPNSNSTSTLARDNREDKENKKRNRFSILSFYSTYNSSLNNIASHATETPQVQQQTTKQAAPVVKSPSTKKILEPSSDANIAAGATKDKKRIGSAGSSRSTTSKKSVGTPSTNSNGGKEASAARKVMDFFKRRSVRIG